MAADKCDVFISYARADYKDEQNRPLPNNVISKITSAFRENNISYWIDEDGIYTGDNFAKIIAKAIKSASVFVFVSTKNSNASFWVQNEVSVAREYKKPILPIKCDESTYADSIIMYLQSLDYCDYKSHPKTAINQLVQAVKENLPAQTTHKEVNQTKGDTEYKESIIQSLSLINDQIIDISQIAVNRILESNERNIMRLHDITNEGIIRLSENETKCAEALENAVHYHLDQINNTTRDELREIVTYLQKLTAQIGYTHDEISKLHHEYAEQQKRTNALLEQLSSVYSTSAPINLLPEAETSNTLVPEKSNTDFPVIANMFLVFDIHKSMVEKIPGINRTMRRFIFTFNNRHKVPGELRLSVLSYDDNEMQAKWQHDTPINIENYDWINLDATRHMSLIDAPWKLYHKLNSEAVVSESDLPSLIIFITDGNLDYEDRYSALRSDPDYKTYKRFCISIGPDANNESEDIREFKIDNTSLLSLTLNHIMGIYLDEVSQVALN